VRLAECDANALRAVAEAADRCLDLQPALVRRRLAAGREQTRHAA
jgi:hypothetical protein